MAALKDSRAAYLSDLLPPLSSEEFDALKADIKANGVLHPVIVDENGDVLDGRHRLKIDPKAPRRVVEGLSDAEKAAFVLRMNFVRRNLSPEQKKEARKRMQTTAIRLREEDAKRWTQKRVAESLGIARETVRDWFGESDIPDGETAKGNKPDARIKLPKEAKEEIAERVEAGEPQAQVAADFGVTQGTVSKVVNAETKKVELKKEREEAAKKITTDCGVHHGDFRDAGSIVADCSASLVFTDPPYDEASIGLYGDLVEFAARVLMPSGWLVAYAGNIFLDRIIQVMSNAGLEWGWQFCCLHAGGNSRVRKVKVFQGWKPLIAFYKPPLNPSWNWFSDVVSGGQEKSDHEWQQAESEAAYFIEQLAPKGGLVVDPFCGSGTTLAAAKSAGRGWVGFEINEGHVQTARVRLNNAGH